MGLFLYRVIKLFAAPFLGFMIMWRLVRGREDKVNFAERRGHASVPRPEGQLLWLHGASVGESMSILPVLRKIRAKKPDLNLLLTTGTATGRKMLLKHAPTIAGTGQTLVQYVPLDTSASTGRFLSTWKPSASVFIESDFWPELLAAAPHPVLLNGRISDRSWPRYQRWEWFFRPLISRFEIVLAQRTQDAERLKALGAGNVHVSGNLKFDADPLPVDPALKDKFEQALQGRPVLVAGSTHPGEEALLAELHMALKPSVPDLLTIIVPRHPHRGTQATNDVLRFTRAVKRRGVGEMPVLGGARHTDVYVADTLGEMGLWYQLATVALIGGSLVPHGGHNPLEPLKLGIPTVTGPHMFNFQDMLPSLKDAKLIDIEPDLPALTKHLQALLSSPEAQHKQREHIRMTMSTLSGPSHIAAETLLALLDKYK